MPIATLPSWKLFSSNLYNLLTKCFIPRGLKAGVRNVGEQEDSFIACVYAEIWKEIPVEKRKSYAGFDLGEEFEVDC